MSSANCPPNLQAILYVEVEFMRNGNFPELHTGLNNLYRGELSLGTFFTSPESRDSTTVKDDGLLVDILQNVANELIIPHASETDIDEVSGDHIRRCIRHCRIIVINGNVNNGRERRLTRSSFIAACQNAVSNDRDFVQLRLSTNHLAVNTSQAITYLNWDPSLINLSAAMSISPAAVRSFGGLVGDSSYTLGPPLPPQNATLTTNANTARFEAALNDVTKRLNEVLTRDTFAVSYSNYYEEKEKQSRIAFWHTQPARDSGSKTLLGKRVLDAQAETGPESKKVKPFWKKFMQEDSEQIVPGISNDYEAASLGPKTPDICFFQSHVATPSAESFIAAGDCKGDKWTGKSTSEKGQIMLYLRKILDAQPNRQHAYGFVTNNKIVVLVKASRASCSPFEVIWEISDVLTYVSGMTLFVDLMTADNGYRPNPTFNGDTVSVQRPLRPGGSCRAYLGRFKGEDVVVKVYSSNELAQANHARIAEINSAMENKNQDGATLPITRGLSEQWLLVQPIGQPFTPTSFSHAHLKCVLNTLKQTHTAGYVHRDVRMANMFDLGGGRILLNDWGSMAAKDNLTPYEGCPPPFSHPLLDRMVQHIPLAKHDLYSLVYSSAKLVAPGFSADAIQSVFGDAFRTVELVDYDGVYASLKPLLFL